MSTSSLEKPVRCDSCRIESLEENEKKWQTRRIYINDIQKACESSKPSVFFTLAHSIRQCDHCRNHLSSIFKIPDIFWSTFCRRSNGYFGSENNYNTSGELSGYSNWTRFQIKETHDQDYKWTHINIFTHWLPSGKSIILSFETPPALLTWFKSGEFFNKADRSDPYSFHAALLGEVVRLQDEAVWGIRNSVRSVEKGRTGSSRQNPRYSELHEISRHAIHVLETLEVASLTVASMQSARVDFFSEFPAFNEEPTKGIRKKVEFYAHALGSLKLRSVSNKQRLENEITLAFNTIAQYDSRISVQIGQAAQCDSAAMKTISFLTLAFLPATFISAMFSMSFFNYTPGTNGEPGKWHVSEEFWVYWVVAGPTSVATVMLWWLWRRYFPQKKIGESR